MKKCDYGCGQEAKYQFKNGKWCCSKYSSRCPALKNKYNNRKIQKKERIENSGYICEYGCGKEAHYFHKTPKKWCCEEYVQQCESRKANLTDKEKRLRYLKNLERAKNYNRKKSEDPEYKKEVARKYREKYHSDKEYREKKIKRRKERYKENPEKELIKVKEWQSKNKDKVDAINKEWQSKNKDRLKKISVSFLNSPSKFDRDAKKIDWFEKVRRDPNDKSLLNVKCKQCNKWFIPTYIQVKSRVDSVLKGIGESHFYDTEECKQQCSVYNVNSIAEVRRFLNGDSELWYTQAELSIWGKTVLERENYICEYCGDQAVHAHHEKAKKLEPFFALDPDNGIACCIECHYKYGHTTHTFCSTGNLAAKVCG